MLFVFVLACGIFPLSYAHVKSFATQTFGFYLELVDGQVVLVNNGVVSAYVASPQSAINVALPAELNEVELVWSVNVANVSFVLQVEVLNQTLQPTNFLSLSYK